MNDENTINTKQLKLTLSLFGALLIFGICLTQFIFFISKYAIFALVILVVGLVIVALLYANKKPVK